MTAASSEVAIVLLRPVKKRFESCNEVKGAAVGGGGSATRLSSLPWLLSEVILPSVARPIPSPSEDSGGWKRRGCEARCLCWAPAKSLVPEGHVRLGPLLGRQRSWLQLQLLLVVPEFSHVATLQLRFSHIYI
jgi:hypothetical protein